MNTTTLSAGNAGAKAFAILSFTGRCIFLLLKVIYQAGVLLVTRGGGSAQAGRTVDLTSSVDLKEITLREQDPDALKFEPADRIIAIRLNPAVAVIHMRIYAKQGKIKRDMIVIEPRLRAILKGRTHSLPDAVYDLDEGLAATKEETVRLAQDLINTKGRNAAQVIQVPANKTREAVGSKPANEPIVVATRPQVPVQTPAPVPVQVPVVASFAKKPVDLPMATMRVPTVAPAPEGKRFVPQPTAGVTFEGQLVRAGTERMTPKGRNPYEVFEAHIRLANGVDMPLRGVELERELERCKVGLGDRVAITPMGKVPVTMANGEEKSKNVYRVVRLDGGSH